MMRGGRQGGGRGPPAARNGDSGPAVMLMPPHIRATFMPPPPLKAIPPIKFRRKHPITGVASFLDKFEKTAPPSREIHPTPISVKQEKRKTLVKEHSKTLETLIEGYRQEQQKCEGKFQGMNCYNTLFVGRLAYEVTETKLLREMEAFGPVRDIKLVTDKEGKSKGYAFVEYENEEDMKRAYRSTDGMKLEGRDIVVDVERGHTVPTWLPRRLGGGLGGTRLGGKNENVMIPGRFDPNRPPEQRLPPMMDSGPMGMGRGQGPPPGYGGGSGGGGPYGGGGYRDGPPPPGYGGYGGPPPRRDYGPGGSSSSGGGGGSGGGDRRRRRSRSRSPERGRFGPRPRY